MPRISFFISHSKEPVTADSLIWKEPIPLRLDALLKNEGESVSHADYFQAARLFLEANRFEAITQAISRQLNRKVKATHIEEARICLEKHGQFYHPSRIETTAYQKQFCFVLNVAVSETGMRFIEKDYHNLTRLNTEMPLHYLPQAYAFGRIAGPGGQNFAMMLGQWFDGYHEFHLSMDPNDNKLKILVWDDVRGRYFLSRAQTQTLYAQASEILTAYYSLESFEQIFSWHHAAGDFIVKAEDEKLDLKLVTARRYGAILENRMETQPQKSKPQRILQALLIFFLSLSIRMRLDRLDGIGEMVWSDPLAVEASLIGFLDALSMKPEVQSLPDSPLTCFIAYLASCGQAELLDLCESIVKRFDPRMPELALVKKHIHRHAETLHGCIRQFLQSYLP